MNLKSWYQKRGLQFIFQRAAILFNRYGISSSKAKTRIKDGMSIMAEYGCSPTFFTPGIVVKHYSRFIQDLQANGAEIAIHSYQHVDLTSISVDLAREQLTKAIHIFNTNKINSVGFRCPYLCFSDELLASLPDELFGYSSNQAVLLELPQLNQKKGQNVIFDALDRFYHPSSFTETPSLPSSHSNLIEIPVCVPDDMQLHDGLNLDSDGISQVWIEMLRHTYQRGELFNLIFHPELGSVCKPSFKDLLEEATRLTPKVWIVPLRDICKWWQEKAKFGVEITTNSDGLKLTFDCSPRATILVKGLDSNGSAVKWDGTYSRLRTNSLEVPANPRPFIGLEQDVPKRVVSFLQEQGYILEPGENAAFCGLFLNNDNLSRMMNDVELVNSIESAPVPLVRYWRWPDGAKSALSITGDLDALSLRDYTSRLFN